MTHNINQDYDEWEWLNASPKKQPSPLKIDKDVSNKTILKPVLRPVNKGPSLQEETKKRAEDCLTNYANNMRRLIMTARTQINSMKSEIKELNHRLESSGIVQCPACCFRFKEKPHRQVPKYMKVFRGKLMIELEFNNLDHLSEWLTLNGLDTMQDGLPTLLPLEHNAIPTLAKVGCMIESMLNEKKVQDQVKLSSIVNRIPPSSDFKQPSISLKANTSDATSPSSISDKRQERLDHRDFRDYHNSRHMRSHDNLNETSSKIDERDRTDRKRIRPPSPLNPVQAKPKSRSSQNDRKISLRESSSSRRSSVYKSKESCYSKNDSSHTSCSRLNSNYRSSEKDSRHRVRSPSPKRKTTRKNNRKQDEEKHKNDLSNNRESNNKNNRTRSSNNMKMQVVSKFEPKNEREVKIQPMKDEVKNEQPKQNRRKSRKPAKVEFCEDLEIFDPEEGEILEDLALLQQQAKVRKNPESSENFTEDLNFCSLDLNNPNLFEIYSLKDTSYSKNIDENTGRRSSPIRTISSNKICTEKGFNCSLVKSSVKAENIESKITIINSIAVNSTSGVFDNNLQKEQPSTAKETLPHQKEPEIEHENIVAISSNEIVSNFPRQLPVDENCQNVNISGETSETENQLSFTPNFMIKLLKGNAQPSTANSAEHAEEEITDYDENGSAFDDDEMEFGVIVSCEEDILSDSDTSFVETEDMFDIVSHEDEVLEQETEEEISAYLTD